MSEKLMQLIYGKVSTLAGTPKMKRLTKPCLVLALGLLLAIPGLAQQNVNIQTGLPIGLSTLTLHVHGQPITVYEFAVSLYRMNTPPPWPIGLWLYTYVQADANDGIDKSTWGQSKWCQWWFNEVSAAEQKNQKQVPYPFFEMNFPAAIPLIQTDEQIQVYPAGSVTCWQADNDYAP
jgi:hypothetical protein